MKAQRGDSLNRIGTLQDDSTTVPPITDFRYHSSFSSSIKKQPVSAFFFIPCVVSISYLLLSWFHLFFLSGFMKCKKGDRFLPNRCLMDLDKAHTLLTSKTPQFNTSSNFNVPLSSSPLFVLNFWNFMDIIYQSVSIYLEFCFLQMETDSWFLILFILIARAASISSKTDRESIFRFSRETI